MVRLATNVSDPVGDLLTRIRNANLAQKDDLVVPASTSTSPRTRSSR
jgi:ribosomal protein S8